ncbi:MAG: esterase-like activity of phytase family protein [Hyphomicrobiaceae bacterium]|nr:esterase-like activity of phytase family protein [Hyphomicrobiaceae bacterium]
MTKKTLRSLTIYLLALATLAVGHGGTAARSARVQAVDVTARGLPFDSGRPEHTQFGKLEWRGTLQLTSPNKDFGGFSGLTIDKTGTRLLAVSDQGMMLSARLSYENGKLANLRDAKLGPIRGLRGQVFTSKRNSDSEAIAMAVPGKTSGKAYIAFERNHRIAVHNISGTGLSPAKRLVKLPRELKAASRNKGIEAMTVVRAGPSKGAIAAFTEEHLDANGDHIGWLLGGRKPGRILLKRLGGFAITDIASLKNGDLVVLERRFRMLEGVKMRLRRIKAGDVRVGATLGGEVLLTANALREIDNMEGIAVHQDRKGRDILTLISDNNFNTRIQRTLLMQFAIAE